MNYDPATLPVFLREETTNRVPNVVLGDITPTQVQFDRTPSVTLAIAVQACVRNNLRVRAGATHREASARSTSSTASTSPSVSGRGINTAGVTSRSRSRNAARPVMY